MPSKTHASTIRDAGGVSTAVNPGITQFLDNDRPYDDTKPKAYLNWILFDNQFNYVASNSGVQQVQPGASKQALVAPLQTIAKNGYLYIYVSNESQQDVYFDDLNVKHYTGPLVQEQGYYPFGLQMAGISDKALNKLSSQYKFNGGVELEEDYGVNLYSTFFRQYDPQLGRFSGVDMLSEKNSFRSTYHFALNDPIGFNDPFGDDAQNVQSAIETLLSYTHGGHWSETGGFHEFQNDEEAFGFGVGYLDMFGAWGGGGGTAGSFNDALQRLNGGDITPGIVQGFFRYHWLGSGRYNITADYAAGVNAGKGFNVGWNYSTDGVGIGGSFVSMEKMVTLLNGGEGKGAMGAAIPIALTASAVDGPIPVGDIVGGVVLVGALAYDITQRVYVTYTLRNPATGQIYAGRASGFGNPVSIMMNRFYGHHMRVLGFGSPVLDAAAQGGWSYGAIRGREQQLIDSYGGVGSPNVANAIRGVSKWNYYGRDFWQASNMYFGNIAPFTGYIEFRPF